MKDSFLNAAEQLLANDPDVIVSVRKLWTLSCETVTDPDPLTLEEFTLAIAHDDRFELISGEWTDTASNVVSTGQSGSAGEHVKLQRIQITPALLTGIMSKKLDTTFDALHRAWEMRPEGDTETENQLLQILAEVKKLQHDLQTLLEDESFRKGEIKNGE
jgi:hypothetical protein